MTKPSIFDACRRRLEAEERSKRARAERMALVAAELGATPIAPTREGLELWELQCCVCNSTFTFCGDALVDGFSECQTYENIRRIVAAARKDDCTPDTLRIMISKARGDTNAP